MYFVLSKTVGALLTPTTFIMTLGLLGFILICFRFSSLGRKLIVAAVLLLLVAGLSPMGLWLLRPLENRFPALPIAGQSPAGIIVLGGSIDPELSAARGFAVFPSAADRLIAAAELARRYPTIPVIFTGGSAALLRGDAREADYAAALFQRLGLPADRVLLERSSRNTIENAAFTKAIVSPKPTDRWILVTSAAHMPRSVGLFRRVGFDVEPYPVDWLTPGLSRWFWFDTPLEGLRRTDIAVREWIGLLADWRMGRSTEFLPSR